MKNKNFYIIVSILLIIIVGLLIFYLNGSNNSGISTGMSGGMPSQEPSNNSGNGSVNVKPGSGDDSNDNVTEVVKLSLINNYKIFFSLNNIINEFYQDMIDDNKQSVFSKFDNNYKSVHKISLNNVKNFMEKNYQSITFYAKDIYVKGINNTLYYFIHGESHLYNFAAETLTEKNNDNYFITYDQSNDSYSITPLASDTDIYQYAKDYKLKKLSIENNEYNGFFESDISAQHIAVHYINYFKNLLYLNTEKAYGMLDKSMLSNYSTYEIFSRNIDEIYNKLSTNIFSYYEKGNDGKKTYSVITTSQIKISFVEKSIMNFTLKIES